MTYDPSARFVAAIERNWPNYTIAPGASPGMSCCGDHEPDSEDLDTANESSFSWQECECCGSTLGGDRHPAHAIRNEAFGAPFKQPDDIFHIEICTDCLRFTANGDLPEVWE